MIETEEKYPADYDETDQLGGRENRERSRPTLASHVDDIAGYDSLRSISLLIAGYGVYAFFKRDIGNYMILANQFVFFDFEEPFLWFLLDYMACMGTCISIGHYGSALFRNVKNAKGRQARSAETTNVHKHEMEEAS